jgi:hypothetical protein
MFRSLIALTAFVVLGCGSSGGKTPVYPVPHGDVAEGAKRMGCTTKPLDGALYINCHDKGSVNVLDQDGGVIGFCDKGSDAQCIALMNALMSK